MAPGPLCLKSLSSPHSVAHRESLVSMRRGRSVHTDSAEGFLFFGFVSSQEWMLVLSDAFLKSL